MAEDGGQHSAPPGFSAETGASASASVGAAQTVTLPGAAGLVEHLDKEVMVCMRDGRSVIGKMRSFDQFANIVLENAVERVVVNEIFADRPVGIFVVRGENVMLLGEVDPNKELQLVSRLDRVSIPDIDRALKARQDDKDAFTRREKLEWPMMDDYL